MTDESDLDLSIDEADRDESDQSAIEISEDESDHDSRLFESDEY